MFASSFASWACAVTVSLHCWNITQAFGCSVAICDTYWYGVAACFWVYL